MNKIGIIGLGYVGLPLAIEFSKKYQTIGFDISSERVEILNNFIDPNGETTNEDLKINVKKSLELNNVGLIISDNESILTECNIYIITVPTPVDAHNKPDLNPLINASKLVSNYLKKDDIVIYESTVFPGATEEICVPILENSKNMKLNENFYVGYSPERINPGDKEHTLTNIKKIVSGSNEFSTEIINNLYKSIINAGTYVAPSIKVAEAAKVIENTQRDINIAFVNELSILFNILDIDTSEVLKAARTKWNFLNFKPGLVGGHCIGVDPYYLAHKATEVGFNPEIILAGRRTNDSMAKMIGSKIIDLALLKNLELKNLKILILGLTFKENCPDIRNTKVVDLINYFTKRKLNVEIYDPLAISKQVKDEYNIELLENLSNKNYDIIIHAVEHNEFKIMDFEKLKKDHNSFTYNIKENTLNLDYSL